MGAIYHHGFCKAVVESLNAGVDLLLIAYDGQQYYRAMSCALDALHKGWIDRAMLEESAQRLEAVRLGKEAVF
jgi:beta-N-acetylhexosaminidase